MYEIIEYDKEVFLFLNNLGSKPFDQFWIMVSKTFIWVPFYVVLFYFLFKNFGKRNMIYIIIFIALGVTISDQMAGIFKDSVMRLRPCHEPTLDHIMREVKCGGQYGFYSAHASNTFFLATFITLLLGRKYPPLAFVMFIWAIVVAYSRIYLGVHYPLDIIFGMLAGISLGWFIFKLTKKTLK